MLAAGLAADLLRLHVIVQLCLHIHICTIMHAKFPQTFLKFTLSCVRLRSRQTRNFQHSLLGKTPNAFNHVWGCRRLRIVMQCGVVPAKLIPVLAAAQLRVKPVCLRSWRSRNSLYLTKSCLSSCSPVQQQDLVTSVPQAACSVDRNALEATFADKAALPLPTTRKLCVLGIDPDISGAIAVLQWHVPASAADLELQDATIQMHDMPITKVAIGKKIRRQVDPLGIAHLVTTLNLSSSTEIRAVLEHPVPNAINGKWSWFSAGYNSGIWKGVLYSHGIPFESVAAKVWKTDMQLIKTGKEGSRELAQKLLPQATPQLKRKKDHGRAEALLLAAWGIGFRRTVDDVAAANAEALADLDDSDDDREQGHNAVIEI